MIERIHLEILNKLNQFGTLTQAAKAMNLSQSALSHSITKLEEQLECSLWRKRGRVLSLTEQGLALLKLSKKILPLFEKAEAELLQSEKGLKSYLRIGMECYPCYRWLSSILPDYLQAWPQIDIDIKQKFKFGAVGALYDYDIDLIITPDPYFREELTYIPVFDYELVAVVARNHGMARKKFLVPIDFVNETLFTYPIPKDRLDVFTKFLIPKNISPKNHKCFETTEMIIQMVAAGRGLAVLPDWLVHQLDSNASLVSIRLGKLGVKKKNYVGFRSVDRELNYIRNFVELAKAMGNPNQEKSKSEKLGIPLSLR